MDATSVAILTVLPWRYAVGILVLWGLCAHLAPFVGVPKAGSIWVRPRQLLDLVAGNYRNAENAVRPGSPEATVRPSDVLREVLAAHAQAQPQREQIAAQLAAIAPAVEAIPGKLADVQRRVSAAMDARLT